MIGSWIKAQAWRLAAGGLGVALIACGIALAFEKVENRHLNRLLVAADKIMNDPKTGLRAQIAQARTNVATLTVALDSQNETIRRISVDDAARLANAERRLKEAQAATRRAQSRVTIMLDPPKGSTLEERVLDVDRRFLETLK